MDGIFSGGVGFAVRDAGARGHALDLAGTDDGTVAHTVFVLELAAQNKCHNFHIAMAVRRKSRAGCDKVLIDDAQRTEMSVGRVLVVAERKRVVSFEPAVVEIAALGRRANTDQICKPRLWQAGSISKNAWIRLSMSPLFLSWT